MLLLLNTIMLEPNRWTEEKHLTRPLTTLLPIIHQAGFLNLEIWQYHLFDCNQRSVEAIKSQLSELGMKAPVLGAYPQLHLEGNAGETELTRLGLLVNSAKLLECSVFKIFAGRIASTDADAAVRRISVERMIRLADWLAVHGITLTLETHGNTLCDTLDSTSRLLDELDSASNIDICFQPYVEDDTDAAIEAFDTLRDRVSHLHLQNRLSDGSVSLLENGTWTDMRRFLPHVKAAGFNGFACLEFTADIIPAEGSTFDLHQVIANAQRDRNFVAQVWG